MMNMENNTRPGMKRRTSQLIALFLICCPGIYGQSFIGSGSASPPTTVQPTAPPFPILTLKPFEATASPQTFAPTQAPVAAPTTTNPTTFPTMSPITTAPTKIPTLNPTTKPTNLPTLRPTLFPTLRPTSVPTVRPTLRPTVTPTLFPTRRPTLAPTISPAPTTVTKSPTISPAPTLFPTTQAPTGRPTLSPTRFPTLSPTLAAQQSAVNVVMRLNYMPNELVTNRARQDFEEQTRLYLLDKFDLPPLYEILEVTVDIYDQDLVEGRRLQAALLLLRVGFDVTIDYRSPNQDDNPAEWISDAFDTEAEHQVFISRLKARNANVFSTVESIGLLVNGTRPGVSADDKDTTGEGKTAVRSQTFWIIIIAAGGGGTALLLGMILIFSLTRRKSHKPQVSGKKPKPQKAPASATAGNSNYENFAAEIHLEQKQDDISTLGDPVGGMHIGAGPRDERTASVGHDYDYAKHFLSGAGRQNSMENSQNENSFSQISKPSALGPLDSGAFQDDVSFEEQFVGTPEKEERLEFQVPAGKLGMVIDTPAGHSPLVHAIKPGSVLDGKVQVGDFLIQVNHQDVTGWTAVKVSKYISALSGRSRLLVFHRGRKRTESSVFMDDGSAV